MSLVETVVVTAAFCEAPTPVFWFRACMPAKFWKALPWLVRRLSAVVAPIPEAFETETPVT